MTGVKTMAQIENEIYIENLGKYPRIGRIMREKLGYTISHLANEFFGFPGMSEKSLKRYEQGEANCPANVLDELAEYYICPIDDLFDDDLILGTYRINDQANFRFTPYRYKETNHGPDIYKDKTFRGYRLGKGLRLREHLYDLIELDHDHQHLQLPKGSKIFFRNAELDTTDVITEQERIYLVHMFPSDIDGYPANHKKPVHDRISFITKAHLMPNTYQPKLVAFYYNNELKTLNSQAFKRGIQGIAEKIIIDLI
jgi:transcriptional regulator with XRE-family HTH domain